MLQLALILLLTSSSASTALSSSTATREGEKTQWAPTEKISALHARAVSRGETRREAGAYAREGRESAAGPTFQRWYLEEVGQFVSPDSVGASSYLTTPNGIGPWSYAALSPLGNVDPDGRCAFADDVAQCLRESWTDIKQDLGLEARPDPNVLSRVEMSRPKPATLPDYDSPDQRTMRFRRQWYRYLNADAPTSGDAADILEWKRQQSSARAVEGAMRVTDQAARFYLREVAVPYLAAEVGGQVLGALGGATARGLSADFAAGSRATARVTKFERFEQFYAAQQRALAARPHLNMVAMEGGSGEPVRALQSQARSSSVIDYRTHYDELLGFDRVAGFGTPELEAGGSAAPTERLLRGELQVDSYQALSKSGSVGDNLTPHHIPANEYMKQVGPAGYTRGEGVSIMMEQPTPGVGGRHRLTASYGSVPDISLLPRDALARDVWDARRIYRQQGLYSPNVRTALQQVIDQNMAAWPGFFTK